MLATSQEPTASRLVGIRLNRITLLTWGLAGLLGAVAGVLLAPVTSQFQAGYGTTTVLIAAFTTAVAGSLSMGAGIYVAISSEKDIKATELAKQQFLGVDTVAAELEEQPLGSALVVGGSYIAGAMVPVLPVLFGAKDALFSLLTAGSMIILVSMVLAFLSGMEIKKRILTNLVIIACAVAITYAIGLAAKTLWGVSL